MNRLPPEIISCIARCTLGDRDFDVLPIIPLTHVCRYWRDSIISAPQNWTLISSYERRLAELSLKRAKAASLAIHLEFQFEREFLDLLRPHVRSTTSLSCEGFNVVEELVQALPHFPESTPKLRSLALAERSTRTEWGLVDPFEFSTHTMLRELSLSYVPLLPSFLSLKTLTKFSLCDRDFQLPLDTLLSFLEENRSLESATFRIKFAEPPLACSQRRTPVGNRLRHLFIMAYNVANIRPLISNIALRKEATLALKLYYGEEGLTEIFSGVPMRHLSNLSSPTFMEYRHSPRNVRLLGADGSFSYEGPGDSDAPFEGFPLLPLANIRELRLKCCGSWILTDFRPSFFPSLEVLAIDGGSSISFLFPELPSSTPSPLLRTLAFLDCVITEDFMATLTQIALHRRNNASTSLHRVVVIDSKRQFPPAASVKRLREHVPVVEVFEGKEFPKDLS